MKKELKKAILGFIAITLLYDTMFILALIK